MDDTGLRLESARRQNLGLQLFLPFALQVFELTQPMRQLEDDHDNDFYRQFLQRLRLQDLRPADFNRFAALCRARPAPADVMTRCRLAPVSAVLACGGAPTACGNRFTASLLAVTSGVLRPSTCWSRSCSCAVACQSSCGSTSPPAVASSTELVASSASSGTRPANRRRPRRATVSPCAPLWSFPATPARRSSPIRRGGAGFPFAPAK